MSTAINRLLISRPPHQFPLPPYGILLNSGALARKSRRLQPFSLLRAVPALAAFGIDVAADGFQGEHGNDLFSAFVHAASMAVAAHVPGAEKQCFFVNEEAPAARRWLFMEITDDLQQRGNADCRCRWHPGSP